MLTVNRHRKICTSERIVLNVHLMTIMYINFGEGCWILDVNIYSFFENYWVFPLYGKPILKSMCSAKFETKSVKKALLTNIRPLTL